LHQLRREASLTQERAEAAMTLATDLEFLQQFAQATPLRGWALAARGHGEEGITQLRLIAYQTTRATRDRPYYLALLAEASAQAGQTAEGLEAVGEALATVAKSAVRWWEAELHRLRGELLLQHAVAQPGEAEACFQQALAVARRQQAKSLELRAAMSLARLWQQQGKRAEAHQLLAGGVGWVTEGCDPVSRKLEGVKGVGATGSWRTFENLLGVWVRTLVQLPPSGCMRDGSTLMPLSDTQRHGTRQGCKAGQPRARRGMPVSQVTMGRYTNVLLNRRQNRPAKA